MSTFPTELLERGRDILTKNRQAQAIKDQAEADKLRADWNMDWDVVRGLLAQALPDLHPFAVYPAYDPDRPHDNKAGQYSTEIKIVVSDDLAPIYFDFCYAEDKRASSLFVIPKAESRYSEYGGTPYATYTRNRRDDPYEFRLSVENSEALALALAAEEGVKFSAIKAKIETEIAERENHRAAQLAKRAQAKADPTPAEALTVALQAFIESVTCPDGEK